MEVDAGESAAGGAGPPPPPPPPPPLLPLGAARIACPLCSSHSAFARPRNLVRHLAVRHCGQELGERGAATLRGLDVGVCCGCGGIRSFRSNGCLHCLPPAPPPRPASADDRIVMPDAVAGRSAAAAPQRSPAALPADWVERVRRLPGHTLPHIPAAIRESAARAMAGCLEALLEDGADHALEQGRAKLLLSPPPKGFHLRAELAKRHELWAEGEWEALLVRAEAQAACRAATRSVRRVGGHLSASPPRAAAGP